MADRIVVAPVVVLPNTAGLVQYYYQGATLPDGLVEERVADAIASGLVSEEKDAAELTVYELDVSAAGDRFRVGAEDVRTEMVGVSSPVAVTEQGDAPPKAASKEAWVDYAVAQGADRAAAEKLGKTELIAKYGA